MNERVELLSAMPTDVQKADKAKMEFLSGWQVRPARLKGLKDCSLIIPTFCRPHELIALLDNLATHEADDLPAEVVVVDGSPGLETEERVAKWLATADLPLALVYVRSQAGLTRQKNVGVDISSGEYLYFLDDDTLPMSDYFREMRRVFAEDTEGHIGAVGGAIMNEMDRPLTFRWRMRLALGLIPRKEPMLYDASGMSLPKTMMKPFAGIRTVDIVPGGASCFRREVFRERRFSLFFQGYSNGEDVEISLRTGLQYRLVLCGSAQLTHHPAPGGRPPGFARGRMEVRNRLFIRKRFWPNSPPKASLRFWADVGLLVALDLALFVRHPGRTDLIRHAAGLAFASLEALVSPPRFEEPPAHRRYALENVKRIVPVCQ